MTTQDNFLEIRVLAVEGIPPTEGQPGMAVQIHTTRGRINAIHHQAQEPKGAVVWVWGARGGYDGPADGIYGVLAEELLPSGISSLRVNYRDPDDFNECVMDTLAGVSLMTSLGYTSIALVGHSLGGAVVISAAPFSNAVKAVVALSSQTFGAQRADLVAPRSLLLVHGEDDTRLGPQCSRQIYDWAKEPKELVLYPGANHGLRECKDQLHDMLKTWLVDKLRSA